MLIFWFSVARTSAPQTQLNKVSSALNGACDCIILGVWVSLLHKEEGSGPHNTNFTAFTENECTLKIKQPLLLRLLLDMEVNREHMGCAYFHPIVMRLACRRTTIWSSPVLAKSIEGDPSQAGAGPCSDERKAFLSVQGQNSVDG